MRESSLDDETHGNRRGDRNRTGGGLRPLPARARAAQRGPRGGEFALAQNRGEGGALRYAETAGYRQENAGRLRHLLGRYRDSIRGRREAILDQSDSLWPDAGIGRCVGGRVA